MIRAVNEMFDEEQGVGLIQSARHVLLNDLQLIKGYISIKQPEKAASIVDRMTDELRQQARLSAFKMPKCCFFLVTRQWMALPFQISLHVSEQSRDFSAYDQMIADFFNTLFEIVGRHASDETDNELAIRFALIQQRLSIRVIFSGLMNDKACIRRALLDWKLNHMLAWVEHYTEETRTNGKMGWTMCLSTM